VKLHLPLLASATLLAATASAQIPAGWYVFGAFGSAGQKGIFAIHPRIPDPVPTPIENLQGDLTVTGPSCILYRQSDGAILAAERAPVGASVDLHVVHLNGTSVFFQASYSLGQGGSCCGEVPQMAELPDGRIVVAATDIASGPLMNYLTTNYGYQGLGIVDLESGLITSIPVTNGASIVDVFNGLALSPDGNDIYVGTYVSSNQGDIYRIPVTGGAATLVATVPAGLSNLGFDADGTLWVTTLNAMASLFQVDVTTGGVTQVPNTTGGLNAIRHEEWTGNFAIGSANSGTPSRSLFWMETDGTEHLLSTPGFGSPSGIDIRPAVRIFGDPTPDSFATYDWLTPNPTGLPTAGNAGFKLIETVQGTAFPGIAFVTTAGLSTPLNLLGVDFHIDLSTLVAEVPVGFPQLEIAIPIPNDPAVAGIQVFLQSVHFGSGGLAATPGLELNFL
jgi:hypothetical protein